MKMDKSFFFFLKEFLFIAIVGTVVLRRLMHGLELKKVDEEMIL